MCVTQMGFNYLENDAPPISWDDLDVSFDTENIIPHQNPASQPQKEQKPTKPPAKSQAEILLGLVEASGIELFQSDTKDLYAVIPIKNHREIWSLGSKDFENWLNKLFYDTFKKPVNNDAVKQTMSVLSAKAQFDNPEPIKLATRVTEHESVFWYDLTNPTWQAVKITAGGWGVLDNPPILFNRYRHQTAQPTPATSGDIRKILNHINMKKGQEILFLCWLASCFVPNIPHPIPIFFGEKGAAKSTTCSFLKMLIDPSALDTLKLQNDERALTVNLQQHWFLPFDNVSYINDETSDTLCRAITGSGIQQRKLFTNGEDCIFTFKRCLAINGINNVATRPDLLDRSLLIELERISETDRRELAEVQADFDADRPAILGGILDTLVKAMQILPTVKLAKLPRMADFTRWGYAIGEALGEGMGQQFLDEYSANRESQNTEAINSDPVALLIIDLMEGIEKWDGKVSELHSVLSDKAQDNGINAKSKSFPQSPNHLSRRLRGIKSNLEAVGITFEIYKQSSGMNISLKVSNLSALPALSA